MSKNIKIGREGEQQAAEYLKSLGWEILHANYRYGRSEIDIIARDADSLVFVEVKRRKNADYGYPEQSVTQKKIEMLRSGAEGYLNEEEWTGPIRFDIVSIIGYQKSTPEIVLFKDAF